MKEFNLSSVCLLAVVLLFSTCAAAQTPFRPHLRVDPDVLPANGISTATITVVVYDSAGFPISDGTPVAFTTTLGTIEPPTATLLSRTARATLRSPTTPGVARISVTVGSGHAEYEVEFVDSETYSRSSRYISVSGDRDTYIAYGVDAQVVTTSGNAEWRFGTITVRTDLKTDFDLMKQVLFAEGTSGANRLTITNGKQTLQGDRLIYNVQRRRGTLFAVFPQPSKVVFSGMDLKPVEADKDGATSSNRQADEEEPDIISPPEYTTAGYWITAQRMTIYPQDKIQFQKAAVYLQGKRLMSWPHYVLPLNGATTSDILGVNTLGGISLDMPFYYRANPSGTGAIRLRHYGSDGFYSDAPGWSLGLEEEYYVGHRGRGFFAADQLFRRDWGIYWQHEHQFSPTTKADIFVDFPYHENLFTRFSLYKDTKAGHLGVETFASRPSEGASTLFTQAYFQTPARRLSKNLSYSTSFNLFHSRNPDSPQANVVGQSANLVLYPRPIPLGKSTALSGSVRTNLFNDSSGQRGVSWGTNWNLRQQLGKSLQASLGYSLDSGGGFSSFGAGRASSHYLTFQLFGMQGNKLHGNLYLTRDLKNQFSYGSGYVSYRLSPLWRVGLFAYRSDFLSTSFNDLEISVGRVIFQRELVVAWSKSRGKIYLELGGWEF
jgi:hypothetical protein